MLFIHPLWLNAFLCYTLSKLLGKRDATLRAIALTSKATYQLFYPSLLHDIAIKPFQFYPVYDVFERQPEARSLVKRFIGARPTKESEFGMSMPKDRLEREAPSDSSDPSSDGQPSAERMLFSMREVEDHMIRFYSQLKRLKALVIFYPDSMLIPFAETVGNRPLVPLSFITNSLKRLHISRACLLPETFSAKKAIWLLVFSPLLQEAILNFSCPTKDERFLLEFHEPFKGLSKVKALALEVL